MSSCNPIEHVCPCPDPRRQWCILSILKVFRNFHKSGICLFFMMNLQYPHRVNLQRCLIIQDWIPNISDFLLGGRVTLWSHHCPHVTLGFRTRAVNGHFGKKKRKGKEAWRSPRASWYWGHRNSNNGLVSMLRGDVLLSLPLWPERYRS